MSSRLLLVCLVFIGLAYDRVDGDMYINGPDREVSLEERMTMIMQRITSTAVYFFPIDSVDTPVFIGKAALDGMTLRAMTPVVVPGGKFDEDKEVERGVHEMKFDFKYNTLKVDVKWFNMTAINLSKECRPPNWTNNVNNIVHIQLRLRTRPICDLKLISFVFELLDDFKIPCVSWGIYASTKKRLADKLKESVKSRLEDRIARNINFSNVVGINPCNILLPKI